MRARIAASVVLATVLLLSTTACTFFSTQATLKAYDPSDGVGASVGDIQVRNALLLTKNGQQASFLVNLINDGQNTERVLIQYESTGSGGVAHKVDTNVTLAPGEVKTFGSKDTRQFVLNGINTKPGALFPVWVQYGSVTGKQMLVPVLDNSLAEYAHLLPTPKPKPTATPTVTPTPTPSPTK